MPIEFIYFDLGNVLLSFCHERMCRQIAEVAKVEPSRVREVLFGTETQRKFELGLLDPDGYFEHCCQVFDRRLDRERLERAACDIFDVRSPMVPVVSELAETGVPMAILSNTNEIHWKFLSEGRFREVVPGPFEFAVLSFEEHSMKPDRPIYQAAVDRAGVAAERVFFVDDLKENVDGAREAGIDAVQFIDEQQLVADLRGRGVRLAQ